VAKIARNGLEKSSVGGFLAINIKGTLLSSRNIQEEKVTKPTFPPFVIKARVLK